MMHERYDVFARDGLTGTVCERFAIDGRAALFIMWIDETQRPPRVEYHTTELETDLVRVPRFQSRYEAEEYLESVARRG